MPAISLPQWYSSRKRSHEAKAASSRTRAWHLAVWASSSCRTTPSSADWGWLSLTLPLSRRWRGAPRSH